MMKQLGDQSKNALAKKNALRRHVVRPYSPTQYRRSAGQLVCCPRQSRSKSDWALRKNCVCATKALFVLGWPIVNKLGEDGCGCDVHEEEAIVLVLVTCYFSFEAFEARYVLLCGNTFPTHGCKYDG